MLLSFGYARHLHIALSRHLEEALQQATANYRRINEQLQTVGQRFVHLKQDITRLNVCTYWS